MTRIAARRALQMMWSHLAYRRRAAGDAGVFASVDGGARLRPSACSPSEARRVLERIDRVEQDLEVDIRAGRGIWKSLDTNI